MRFFLCKCENPEMYKSYKYHRCCKCDGITWTSEEEKEMVMSKYEHIKSYYRKRYENDRDYRLNYQKQYYRENKDFINNKSKQRYVNNLESEQARSRNYYYEHKDEINAKRRTEEYKSKRRIYQRNYYRMYGH